MRTLKVLVEDFRKSKKDTPFLDYARYCLEQGMSPDTRVEFYRKQQQDEPDVIIPNIGKASKLTVHEGSNGPVFVKYSKMEEKDKARLRLKGRSKPNG